MRAIRLGCAVVFVASIAGLIISSIAGNNEGWVLTSGMCGAVAAIILLAVSFVTSTKRVLEFSEAHAENIEQRIATLVAAGVDEEEIRNLVRSSVRLGRGL